MRIGLSQEDVLRLAAQYDGENRDEDEEIGPALRDARDRGFLTKDDLLVVAKWKWKGGAVRRLCEKNFAEDVQEISAASFSARSEQLRVGALLALHGVNWPMASVILHFVFETYPILDFRSMRTIGGSTSYNYANWRDYTDLCREVANKYGVSMRALDKALWQFDKQSQGGL